MAHPSFHADMYSAQSFSVQGSQLAGSKRLSSGEVVQSRKQNLRPNTADSTSAFSCTDGDGKSPQFINPSLLCCPTCCPEPTAHRHPKKTRQTSFADKDSDTCSITSQCQKSLECLGCLPCDDWCFDMSGGMGKEPHDCSTPCTGSEDCNAPLPCADPLCEGVPCFEPECSSPACTEPDCPDNNCPEAICDAATCLESLPWSLTAFDNTQPVFNTNEWGFDNSQWPNVHHEHQHAPFQYAHNHTPLPDWSIADHPQYLHHDHAHLAHHPCIPAPAQGYDFFSPSAPSGSTTSFTSPTSAGILSPTLSSSFSLEATPAPSLASTHSRHHSRFGIKDEPGVYTCRWCTNSIPCMQVHNNAQALHTHILKSHTSSLQSSYTCLWSGCSRAESFQQRGKLERHLLTHSGYKPHKCDWDGCGQAFPTRQILQNHYRTHTKLKPYECETCGKRCSTQSQYKTHLSTHTQEKRYACPHPGCSFRCADASNLSKHKKTHQGPRYGCLHPGCTFQPANRWDNAKRHFKESGHCPELLIQGGEEQRAYKQRAEEEAMVKMEGMRGVRS